MKDIASRFRLLGDATRLRLLRVLQRDRFNVSELTAILGVAQSGVSRHLGLLRDAGFVHEGREGGFVYYALADREASQVDAEFWSLLETHGASSDDDPSVREDDARFEEVLRLRQESFDTHGDTRQLVPGRSWAAWARALGHLLPAIDVADVGCGEGYLAIEAAQWARNVIGIDRSDDVLERAKSLATRRGVDNVQWKKGEFARLPLNNRTVDLVLLSQALHHAGAPEEALTEAARILRPDGRVLVLELREHDQDWVRTRYGDRHLGFSKAELERLLTTAGFVKIRITTGARRSGDPFVVLIASGQKPRTTRHHDDH